MRFGLLTGAGMTTLVREPLARIRAGAYVIARDPLHHVRSAAPRTNTQRARRRGGVARAARAHLCGICACPDAGADDRVSAAVCLRSRTLRSRRAARRGLARRVA